LLFRPVTLRRRDKDVCSNCNRDWLLDKDSTWHGDEYDIPRCAHCHIANPRRIVLKPVELRPQPEPWEIRESHTVQSEGLMRNGEYFASPNEITVTHTSHETVTLPAGEYRVYRLQVAGAD